MHRSNPVLLFSKLIIWQLRGQWFYRMLNGCLVRLVPLQNTGWRYNVTTLIFIQLPLQLRLGSLSPSGIVHLLHTHSIGDNDGACYKVFLGSCSSVLVAQLSSDRLRKDDATSRSYFTGTLQSGAT